MPKVPPPDLSIGDMVERVTLQALTDTGGGNYAWTDVVPETWARVEPVTGQFSFRSGTTGLVPRRFNVYVRYEPGREGAARVLWRSKTLEIRDEANPDERQRFIMFSCGESLATALVREIAQKGQPITVRRFTNTPSDPTMPWSTVATSTDVATRGLLDAYTATEINGESILAGDRRVFVVVDTAWGSVRPLPDDRVVLSDGTVTIVQRIDRISPLDPIEAYSLQVRG